jgi:iron complex outermembrane receptor protein
MGEALAANVLGSTDQKVKGLHMNKTASNLRRQLMLFTACTMASTALAAAPALAQTTTTAPTDTYQTKKIVIQYKKLLLNKKDLASAITVLGEKDIQATNPTQGSIQTLLTRAPSVQAYSQGPGQSAPTLAIRGVKNDELSETLDGVPISSFTGDTGDYLTNNVGSPVTLTQIGGSTIYPGIAAPEDQGFGTVGGTIAYTSKQPTDDRSAEIHASLGSFDTHDYGFTLNSGKLGDSVDAPKVMMNYDQEETAGYVSNTPAQYHSFMMNAIKPYNDGTSQFGLLILFNQGKGTIQSTPTPVALIDANKWTYNFPKTLGFYNQAGQFLTVIAHDHTFINEYLDFEGSLFYTHATDTVDSYAAPSTTDGTFPYSVNVQAPVNFYGDIGPSTYHYSPGFFTYDPTATFGSTYAGESSEYTKGWGNRIGFTPKLTISLPDNTITIGGLAAKESGSGAQYIYGGTQAQENQINGYDSFALGGGVQRTVYVGYISDKIRLFNDILEIEPGARVTAAYTSTITQMSSYYQNVKYQNYTKVGEPYINIVVNAPYHLSPYVTAGKSSLFSPTADYAGGLSGLPGTTHTPNPEIVHTFEAGLGYDTPRMYIKADYFYQQIDDAFSFFENYDLGQFYYANQSGQLLRGIETQGEFKITPAWSIHGNLSFNSSKYTQSSFAFVTLQNDQFGYQYKGTPLSNTPDVLGNIALDYDSGPISAELSGHYTGKSNQTTDIIIPDCNYVTNIAACQEPLSGATITDPNNANDPDFLMNFTASYKIPIHSHRLESLTATFTALNFIDTHYFTYKYYSEIAYNGTYSVLPQYESGLIGPPRSLTLDLSAKF